MCIVCIACIALSCPELQWSWCSDLEQMLWYCGVGLSENLKNYSSAPYGAESSLRSKINSIDWFTSSPGAGIRSLSILPSLKQFAAVALPPGGPPGVRVELWSQNNRVKKARHTFTNKSSCCQKNLVYNLLACCSSPLACSDLIGASRLSSVALIIRPSTGWLQAGSLLTSFNFRLSSADIWGRFCFATEFSFPSG